MEPILDRILHHYGLSKEDYAAYAREPSFSSLPRLEGHKGVAECKSRILEAAKSKEKVLVYGDYDTDGVMSTSIMVKTLRALGVHVSFYLPSRYTDGYGLTLENAVKIADKGYKLVILVDNGITLISQIDYLLSRNIDVIVIDHHEMESELPHIDTIIHPDYSSYGDVPVSAGYLSFIFSLELIGRDDFLLCLGGLSTISDMMPLKSHNREIVRLMIDILNQHRYKEFDYLLKKPTYNEANLSIHLIPQINAVGRMDEGHAIQRLVHYFADGSSAQLPILADWMAEVNERRKTLTNLAMERLEVEEDAPAIIVLVDLPEGLNGLLANRLLNQYGKPVAVFSSAKGDPSLYVGSVRSLEGFDFMEAKAYLEPYLVRSGGHAHAGGMSVSKECFDAFKQAFYEFARLHPCHKEEIDYIPLYIEEANFATYEIIKTLSPFGQDFKPPVFKLEAFPLDKANFTFKGGYFSVPIGDRVKLFSFSIKKESLELDKSFMDLSIEFSLNEFRGQVQLDLFCGIIAQY